MTSPDALIIGAGIVGSSTALELARKGYRVQVVDKADGPGMGSTSASSAIIRFNYSTVAGIALAWEAKHRWESWAEYLGFADPNGLAVFHRTGKVMLEAPVINLTKMAENFETVGVPYELWDAETVASRTPGIDNGSFFPPKPVDADEFFDDPQGSLGGIFTPDAGFVDDPRLAAANLAAAAKHRGAVFSYRRRVTAIDHVGAVWRVELDGTETIEAPILVNAAGPWSSTVNAMAAADDDFTISVAPMRQEVHQVPAPRALRDHPEAFVEIADLDLGIYMRPDTLRQHLLIGGTEPECDPLQWIDDPDDVNLNPTVQGFESQVTRAARRFPDLAIPNRPSGIAGVYDVAADWTPIYDKTSQPGFYVGIGTSGNQFKNAPVIGDLMSQIIDRVENGHDHDANPVQYACAHTGIDVDLGLYSRKRAINAESSGTVLG